MKTIKIDTSITFSKYYLRNKNCKFNETDNTLSNKIYDYINKYFPSVKRLVSRIETGCVVPNNENTGYIIGTALFFNKRTGIPMFLEIRNFHVRIAHELKFIQKCEDEGFLGMTSYYCNPAPIYDKFERHHVIRAVAADILKENVCEKEYYTIISNLKPVPDLSLFLGENKVDIDEMIQFGFVLKVKEGLFFHDGSYTKLTPEKFSILGEMRFKKIKSEKQLKRILNSGMLPSIESLNKTEKAEIIIELKNPKLLMLDKYNWKNYKIKKIN